MTSSISIEIDFGLATETQRHREGESGASPLFLSSFSVPAVAAVATLKFNRAASPGCS
jgi:hypothetical protein